MASYRKILWSLKAAGLVVSIIALLWNSAGTAAEVAVKFQSDCAILNTNLVALRLCEILQYDVLLDTEMGPGCKHSISGWDDAYFNTV